VSKAEILSAIPKLSHAERREIMRSILEAEVDSQVLAECDRLALERFQMLDAMEAEDDKNSPR
jgi:FlaA1/EpsC-like NDP-sugar epimerase